MKEKKILNIQGAILDKYQLNDYLEKIASNHTLVGKSNKETYPIKRLKENYEVIKMVYRLLNEHIKLEIPIHPAGEWILDNLYIIEEIVKNISKELTLKKYTNFLGLSNGYYVGYARIYVLASEMIGYTDGKINSENLKEMLKSYQNKKTLSMDEIWNIGLFLQISLIENIRQICEKIYMSQIQKYKVERIIAKTVIKDEQNMFKDDINIKSNNKFIKDNQIKYAFIEYMSYRLKKYGRQSFPYLKILEEQVNKAGSTIETIIKKEHFDIAVSKVSIGNNITSLKNISRINFLEIFEEINGVEEILKKDPAKQYNLMDTNTKVYYRNTIKEISKKTKLSEIYIANKCLEISQKGIGRKSHIGYYLIDNGKTELLNVLLDKNMKTMSNNKKTMFYISTIWILTFLLDIIFSIIFYRDVTRTRNDIFTNIILTIFMFSSIIFPLQNISTKIIQYILSKVIKPRLIPKLDFQNGIPNEYCTAVVIPTILKNKEQVIELFKKLEIYYIANKSENMYFILLGDCTSSMQEFENLDNEIIEQGIEKTKELNSKYKDNIFDKFNFIYRKRTWNEQEGYYLGWERKRGLLNQFNEYILGHINNPFRINSIDSSGKKIPKIKYIITLDSDTDLTLNSGLELVGTMAHILNNPVLNEDETLVVAGHGIIAPRVGISLENSKKSIYTIIYGGQGGTDSYENAISDLYQDVFNEGIYAGKGIYDLNVFSTVLNNEIRENLVLSHDLLEGCYLRSGYASDIVLMDGCPTNYISERKRLYRWTRGDWQITPWLGFKIKDKDGISKKNPLSVLSKYKIVSNLIRSKQEKEIIGLLFYIVMLSILSNCSVWKFILLAIVSLIIPTILDIINKIICDNGTKMNTKSFTRSLSELTTSIYRSLLKIMLIPDKAYIAVKAELVTMYRLYESKKHLLEWETSEEVEKNSKQDLWSYIVTLTPNEVLGIICLSTAIYFKTRIISIFLFALSIIWIIAPFVMYGISKKIKNKNPINLLDTNEKDLLLDVAFKTWLYFKNNIKEENNYLPPDNYQEDRDPKLIKRTSSTNIGLAILAVISAYDLKYQTLVETIELLNSMLNTILILPKWNGHLYNWYNIEKLNPLSPKYVSSVDSGNFIGYLYVLKQFLCEAKNKMILNSENQDKLNKVDRKITEERDIGNNDTILKINSMITIVENIISGTDFRKLYDNKNRLFSVGYNVEDNKLTDSYYDLLASEARQTSLVAIAKKDISPKHWNNLSRSLTSLNGYKGLISWSGTSFEYLMPNMNIPLYRGSILDESCRFMIMSQIAYAAKLAVPWGFSEAAFNLKDLYNNYQYKAFGIPWLGLKRGLADEIVVSAYGTIMALQEAPKLVINNIKRLKDLGMYDKYGFYEAIDYTPTRVKKKYEIVKTYMAHHQGLILLSINNLFNNKILQKRFMKNPELEAIKILLEERMPNDMVITKEEKEKVEKIKYKDYEDYNQRSYNKINNYLNISNVISNDKYTIVMDQYGNSFSKYNDIQINRYKYSDDEEQGILFFIKDIQNKRIWTNTYSKYLSKPDKYNINFYPDMNKISRTDGSIETVTKVITATSDPVEIRRLELSNTSMQSQTLEITSYIEPIISNKMQDYAHKAFNNLFITYEYIEPINTIIAKRKARNKEEQDIYIAVKLFSENQIDNDIEYEIDKEKFYGRDNINLPNSVENSIPLSKKIENVTDPIIALRKIININPEGSISLNLIMAISENKDDVIKLIGKFMNVETIKQTFELSKVRIEAETRYLGISGNDIELYQRMLAYLLFPYKANNKKINKDETYPVSELWKLGISGDLPILLIKIKDVNDLDTVTEIINAYEYYRTKNIKIDLVILNEEKEKYENYVKDAIQSVVLNKNMGYLFNINGGIHFLECLNEVNDIKIIENKANVILNASEGTLKEQINDLELKIKESVKQIGFDSKKEVIDIEKNEKYNNKIFNDKFMNYYNEYGGFSKDGKEYFIKVNKNSKLPTVWSHILTNKNFGTLVTESLGGYTWKNNSRLNRITAWSNNQVSDLPSEIIYVKDMINDKKWSLGLNPMPDENDYYITYGFGYAKYLHVCDEIEQDLTIFVPINDNVKVDLVHLENKKSETRKLKIIYYIKPVLDEDEIKSNEKINLEYDSKHNMILLRNLSNCDFKDIAFITSSEKIISYTGNKSSFFYNSNISNPKGLDELELNRDNSYGKDCIVAIQLSVKIEANSSKDISIILGSYKNKSRSQDVGYKYTSLNNCNEELKKTIKYWTYIVEQFQVDTPSKSTNILLNGWLIYQVITSRMYGRTGFYQSGGAYGFRDQLQDTMSIKYYLPELARNQIIKHCSHQFIEGDVEHWWHDETSRGIRTRFSDDLLWLPYVIADYIEFCQDYNLLDEEVPYLEGNILEKEQNERYDLYKESIIKENVYNHCIRAIEKSLKFGINELPLIGTGDWNDGFSNVGTEGKGESVWLGFFLYDVLKHFIKLCDYKKDKEHMEKYKKIMEKLKKSLNKNGWDGRWYRRAYMDNGDILGSLQNEECRIDSISQSWSVISDAGDNDKKYISLESLENHLIDEQDGIIKLLDPPFEKGKVDPGYIKSYIPGTRENGGQYTHGAIWAIIAFSLLNLDDKAFKYFKMINPIEHSKTKELANKYKVEPYVMAADVYGTGNLLGRGGWTWYTGSASWMLIAGLKYILGINIENGYLKIQPHIPKEWNNYSMNFKYNSNEYDIEVERLPKEERKGQQELIVNESVIPSNKIKLDKANKKIKIKIILY